MACLSRYAVAPNIHLVASLPYLDLMQLTVDGNQESTHACIYVHEHPSGNLPFTVGLGDILTALPCILSLLLQLPVAALTRGCFTKSLS